MSNTHLLSRRTIWVNGPVIIGAGPSGLAVAASLHDHGVPYIILEKSNCIASLWQNRTYDRLKLHLPKQFCQLPKLPFPENFPQYPSKKQFISYLQSYAEKFEIKPQFNECVKSAKYDESLGVWTIETEKMEYVCRWVVVASGENARKVTPEIEGLNEFKGKVIHACEYRTGEEFEGKNVAVVGCGNSGMEIALDLCNHNAVTSMVCRSSVHVLPREVAGKSTYELAFLLLKWLPLWLVDKLLLIFAWLILGNTDKFGLKRPSKGPLELKNTQGKTPVLDIGTLSKIRSGDIKVVPEIKRFSGNGVEFVNGEKMDVDSVILATGYRSNVPYWLQDNEFFDENGFPRSSYPNGWKGKGGLYAVGFTRRGLSGASMDAVKVAQDIANVWKEETKQRKQTIVCHRRCISTF